MSDPKKLLPKTAKVRVISGLFGEKILITVASGDGKTTNICYISPLLKLEHALIVAEAMAEAVRNSKW